MKRHHRCEIVGVGEKILLEAIADLQDLQLTRFEELLEKSNPDSGE